MTASDGRAPDDGSLVEPPAPGQPQPRRPVARRPSPFRGCLKAIGVLALFLGALLLVAFIFVWIQLGSMSRSPDPVAAPVRWTTRDVVLTRSQPVVRGLLSIQSSQTLGQTVTIGLNAGAPATPAPSAAAPSAQGSIAPASAPIGSPAELGAALGANAIRLTATDPQGNAQQCEAPCELNLAQLSCLTSACGLTYSITVELLGGGDGAGPVTVAVAGGGSGLLGDALPQQFSVDLTLDAPAPTRGP